MSGGHPVSADRSGTETVAKRIPNVRLKVATEQHCFHEDAEVAATRKTGGSGRGL